MFKSRAKRARRSGRNLPVAITVALSILTLVLLSLLLIKELFIAFAALAVGLGLWELKKALAIKNIHLALPPLIVGAIGMLVSSYYAGLEGLAVSFFFTVAGTGLWRLIEGGGASAVRDIVANTFATIYLPLVAGFVILLLAEERGHWYVLLFILLPVANDVGGFFAGTAFGKHPMAASISPKKSWEGFAGSLLLSIIVSLVGASLLLGFSYWTAVALGVVTTVLATFGDLSESLIKRDLGIKDMGSLLPEHGGVLDRIDSMLLSAPFFYIILSVSAGF